MQLNMLDWSFVVVFFLIMLVVGLVVARKAGRSSSDFFLSGRTMPWWLLGFSMVATTFSTDTPNLVTDIVRQKGVCGNWLWWAFLLTGMLTVFVYARLWRRSEVLTDVEFYEIRYSGRAAAFLRGFRAIYLGFVFNIMVMASVSLAAIKIGNVMLGLSPLQSILIASIVTAIACAAGGLKAVLLTDFILFIVAMVGAIVAAVVAVNHPDVGGLHELFSNPAVVGKLRLVPRFDLSTPESRNLLFSVFLIPLAVQWWSVWYPGSEPGGGGYLAQRMLAAKNERHATGATLFFNCAHYALRPWPWIIVALASLIVFPDLASLKERFPGAPLGNDLAYPAMLTFLPHGWLGLVVASLIAAYMSTISTQLNLGSSYLVNDFYRRFIRPDASEKTCVMVGRVSTLLMMVLAAGLALCLTNALQMFNILLQVGAGTGLLFILRWFWWRVNALSEIVAMLVSFMVAVYFQFVHPVLLPDISLPEWQRLCIGVVITSICWIATAFLTKPAEESKLRSFCSLINPGGPGWKGVYEKAIADGAPIQVKAKAVNLPLGILCMMVACVAVYSSLFAIGMWLYGKTLPAVVLTVVASASVFYVFKAWDRANE